MTLIRMTSRINIVTRFKLDRTMLKAASISHLSSSLKTLARLNPTSYIHCMDSSQPPAENAAVHTDSSAEQPAGAGASGTECEDAGASFTETPGVADATAAEEKNKRLEEVKAKWPGWPGYSVFRLVVPVLKVGGIIGRKGDLVKKLVEETRATVRVLDGPLTSLDRIVLITGKEEPDAALSPAMDAIIRIFKRVNGLPHSDADGNAAGPAFCSIRLLVPSIQAISLIGKQGSMIKSIQETTGASVRVLSNDEIPIYANSDERIVELQGEALKVLKSLQAVVGHLRKFLVDQSVLPLFEKSYNAPATQERHVDSLSSNTLLHATTRTSSVGDNYPVSVKRDSLFIERDNQMIDTRITSSRHSLYEAEYGLGIRSSTLGRPVVTQTMQIPLAYAEDLIGVQGANIDYIRRNSGALLTVQESAGLPEEITVEIKGTSSQVQAAQQLIQQFTGGHRESLAVSYAHVDSSLRPPLYSRLGSSSYPASSSFSEQPYGSYGSSGAGRYSSFGL